MTTKEFEKKIKLKVKTTQRDSRGSGAVFHKLAGLVVY